MSLTLDGTPAELADLLAWTRRAIDDEFARRLMPPAVDHGRLVEAMRYAATGPGKRLRPALAIAACEACGGRRADALPAAVAIELLHCYTLVHDDLPAMDDDDTRRGRPTVHIAFGEAIAILAGDGLLTLAFGALAELAGERAAAATAVLARRAGASELLAGQALDLAITKRDGSCDAATLETLHAAKTGALFAAAAELGAIAGGASTTVRDRLARYGLAIGVAFQHADDRDDDEFADHAAASAARVRELTDEACTIARELGPAGATLDAIARWFAAAVT